MRIHIKNCGLTTFDSIECAVRTGATHIGLMHYPPSPRHLDVAEGARLRAHIPEAVSAVAVMVNPDEAMLDDVVNAWKPDALQLHGIKDYIALRVIHERYGIPVILASGVTNSDEVHALEALAHKSHASMLLLDAAKIGMHGGTGERFDWNILANNRPTLPWFLAGGLNPKNVADAVRQLSPYGVDVSSGIEEALGKKSLEKIAAFNQAVLGSSHDTK
jgi:phosphoribosylanthranilate isomerase